MLLRLVFGLLLCLCLLGADWPDLRARRRTGVRENRRAAALIPVTAWDKEPVSPDVVAVTPFARALRQVCGQMPKARPEQYAEWIIASAKRYGEDPFLIAALMHRSSRCLPDARNVDGLGLTAIQPSMYANNVRGRTLRYLVPGQAGFETRERVVGLGFFEQALLTAQANLEWSAALLAMWREQHEAIDSKFEQQPHRHYVSHFIWGDRVKLARLSKSHRGTHQSSRRASVYLTLPQTQGPLR